MNSAPTTPEKIEASTPIEVVAFVSQLVTKLLDRTSPRLMGNLDPGNDTKSPTEESAVSQVSVSPQPHLSAESNAVSATSRALFPLLVAESVVRSLKNFGISAHTLYGRAAWIEIDAKMKPIWAGTWESDDHPHFWAATKAGEVIDLNASIAYQIRSASNPNEKTVYSSPMIWCASIPRFYRYHAKGVADLGQPKNESDRKLIDDLFNEIDLKCQEVIKTGRVPMQSSADGSKMTSDALMDKLQFPNEPFLVPDKRILDSSDQKFMHFDRAISISGIPKSPF